MQRLAYRFLLLNDVLLNRDCFTAKPEKIKSFKCYDYFYVRILSYPYLNLQLISLPNISISIWRV